MWRDSAYLLDILLAAREALALNNETSREELETNRVLQLATQKLVENIGEAARNISDEFKSAHPEVPWRLVTGMRNKLVHEYFQVNLDLLWNVIDADLEELVRLIEPLVPSDES